MIMKFLKILIEIYNLYKNENYYYRINLAMIL